MALAESHDDSVMIGPLFPAHGQLTDGPLMDIPYITPRADSQEADDLGPLELGIRGYGEEQRSRQHSGCENCPLDWMFHGAISPSLGLVSLVIQEQDRLDHWADPGFRRPPARDL
jgi:hypothetical protein